MSDTPTTGLNAAQVAALLRPIKPGRVMQANGQSHVPAYDVAAHLTRILGFGNWDTDLLSATLLFEDGGKEGKRWTVGYSATVRLTVKDESGNVIAHWENGACGDAVNQPSRADAHHLAMTTAISTAMKRCAAFGLGDQFGLSLYNKGDTRALVKTVLVQPEGTAPEVDLESHIVEPQSLGNDERQQSVAAPESEPTGITHADALAALADALKDSGKSRAEQKAFIEDVVSHPLATFTALTTDEALQVTQTLLAQKGL